MSADPEQQEQKKQRMDALSPRSRSLVDAMNLSLGMKISEVGVKVDNVQGALSDLSSRVSGVETKVSGVEQKVGDQGTRLQALEQEVASLKANGGAPPPLPSTGDVPDSNKFPPKGQRRTVVFCFWPGDTPRDDIVADLRKFAPDPSAVDEDGYYTPARFCNKGKIRFKSVSKMWAWIKAHKGVKFNDDTVWWAIDKPQHERLASKKVSKAVSLVKEYIVEREGTMSDESLRNRVPADYDNGFVMFKASAAAKAVRILELPRGETLWAKSSNAPELVGFDWAAALAAINGE